MPQKEITAKQLLDQINDPVRKQDMATLDRLIRKSAPKAKPFVISAMSKATIGYGKYHYKSKSGREGEWFLVGLANQKNYISLYICAVDKNGDYVADAFKKDLPKAKIGKSCVSFKKVSDVDTKVLEKMIKLAVKAGPMSMV